MTSRAFAFESRGICSMFAIPAGIYWYILRPVKLYPPYFPHLPKYYPWILSNVRGIFWDSGLSRMRYLLLFCQWWPMICTEDTIPCNPRSHSSFPRIYYQTSQETRHIRNTQRNNIRQAARCMLVPNRAFSHFPVKRRVIPSDYYPWRLNFSKHSPCTRDTLRSMPYTQQSFFSFHGQTCNIFGHFLGNICLQMIAILTEKPRYNKTIFPVNLSSELLR